MTNALEHREIPPRRAWDDPHRPRYHFLAPANWLNDPNGLIEWRGRYHLFYQYNPNGPFWGTIHWGHAVSSDLVHWTDLPIALAPSPDGPDADGCFSGCAVDHHGVPTIIYTGVRGDQQLPCLATSRDDDLIHWQKYPGNPVIAAPPHDRDIVMFRDHSVWPEDGAWYQLVGSGIKDAGGAALLYRSDDLIDWHYLHPIHVGDKDQTEPISTGLMWECPSFVALGDRYVLIVSVIAGENARHVAYLAGAYANHRLAPATQGLVDAGGHFYAPQVFIDSRDRRVMFGWLTEGRGEKAQRASGWSGVISLPRVLSLLPDGTLGMTPAPELEALRGNHHHVQHIELSTTTSTPEEPVRGDTLEILAVLDPAADAAFSLAVRRSPDGGEETLITYDRASHRLTLDTRRSSLDDDAPGDIYSAQIELAPGEPLRLHLFLDRSVIELFANNRACLTARVYPSRPDSLGLTLLARSGRTTLRSLDIWEMSPI